MRPTPIQVAHVPRRSPWRAGSGAGCGGWVIGGRWSHPSAPSYRHTGLVGVVSGADSVTPGRCGLGFVVGGAVDRARPTDFQTALAKALFGSKSAGPDELGCAAAAPPCRLIVDTLHFIKSCVSVFCVFWATGT
jgi:hypothetical protein